MQRRIVHAALAALLLLACRTTLARNLEWGGLGAVAVSPDGKLVAAGGDNRVIYVLDGETLEVKRRIWVRARVGALAFNRDGSRLVLEDDDEVVRWFDTKTWEVVHKLEPTSWNLSFAPSADLMAGQGRSGSDTVVRFISMTDGSPKGEAKVPGRIAHLALGGGGGKVAVLLRGVKGEEPKVPSGSIPKELKDVAKSEFIQRNDGKTGKLIVFEVPSGKVLREHDTFYTSDGAKTDMGLAGDTAYVLNFEDCGAKFTKDGATEIVKGPLTYNYGRGFSPDGTALLVGSLRDGARVGLPSWESVPFSLDRLPGWPEYFTRFVFHPDGTGYGVTTAYRLVKITKEGKIEKAVPVF